MIVVIDTKNFIYENLILNKHAENIHIADEVNHKLTKNGVKLIQIIKTRVFILFLLYFYRVVTL